MEKLKWQLKSFAQLSPKQLFSLYHLRTAVFVVEQTCAYQEVDEHDLVSHHLLGFSQQSLVACARICPPQSVYPQASIGRVAIADGHRGKGQGRLLFKEALAQCHILYPQQELKIQAQVYLEKFYQSFGFKTISEPYPDFGIMHVDMVLAIINWIKNCQRKNKLIKGKKAAKVQAVKL